MKRIIDGRSFDTETATHIVELHCSANCTDFAYHDTSLYRSPKGQFFIAGEGGAMSMWSQPVGNNGRGGGSGMRLVDDDEARAIMEANGCDADDFAAVGLSIEEG